MGELNFYCITLILLFSEEERRAKEDAIRVLREEIYCLEIQIAVLYEEWNDVNRWAGRGGDVNAVVELLAAIGIKRGNMQLKLEEARWRLLELLAESY